MPLSAAYKQNFDILRRAVFAGDAALMECQLAATGETVAVVCAANRLAGGGAEFVPLAMLFADDPYHAINPPKPDGGFYSQDPFQIDAVGEQKKVKNDENETDPDG